MRSNADGRAGGCGYWTEEAEGRIVSSVSVYCVLGLLGGVKRGEKGKVCG